MGAYFDCFISRVNTADKNLFLQNTKHCKNEIDESIDFTIVSKEYEFYHLNSIISFFVTKKF